MVIERKALRVTHDMGAYFTPLSVSPQTVSATPVTAPPLVPPPSDCGLPTDHNE